LITHQLRCIGQTPRTFVNWPNLLAGMGRSGSSPVSLTFRIRTGQRIRRPNVPAARVPVYKVLAEDCYRLDWFLGPLLKQPITIIDIGAHVGAFACRIADRITVDERAVSDHIVVSFMANNQGGSSPNGLVAEVDAPDIVKIDCEGGEYDGGLLASSARWARLSHMVIEYYRSTSYTLTQLREWLAGVGLHVVSDQASGPGQGTAWLKRLAPGANGRS
jgi:hypothetical protein